MATSNIKRIVLDAIAAYFATHVAGLFGKVSANPVGPEVPAGCLALKIIPNGFVFQPNQSDEDYEADPDDGKIVSDVGQFVGSVTLYLYTNSPAERELYEQRILDQFFATTWAAGTIFYQIENVPVRGYVATYVKELKMRLESEDWNEEMAFESKRFSFIDVYVEIPALTIEDAASSQLKIANLDIPQPAPQIQPPAVPDQEVVEIQLDGTTIKSTL